MRMHQMLPGLSAPATIISPRAPNCRRHWAWTLRGHLQGSRDKGKLELHLSQT